MAVMQNEGMVDGFLMKAPRDTSKGDQRIARFHVAHHYFSHGMKQFFIPVVCYGKSADHALDDADLRAGDLVQVKYKLKGMKFRKEGDPMDSFGCELICNWISTLKKGKQHPEGGDEQFIGIPEGV